MSHLKKVKYTKFFLNKNNKDTEKFLKSRLKSPILLALPKSEAIYIVDTGAWENQIGYCYKNRPKDSLH